MDSWVPDRMKPINSSKTFPLSTEAVAAFESLMKSIEESVVTAIDENLSFEMETDASEVALTATQLHSSQGLYKDQKSDIRWSIKRLKLSLSPYTTGSIISQGSISV